MHRVIDGREAFTPLEPISVVHPMTGPFTMPPGRCCFTSDLASVPWPFAWLVGRTGVHLRAAVLHDWLIHELGRGVGPCRDRVEADRVFADLMAVDGVQAGRRHLIHLAVSVATVIAGGTGWRRAALVVATAAVPGAVLLPATVVVVVTRGLMVAAERAARWSLAGWRRVRFVVGGRDGQFDRRWRDEPLDSGEVEAA